MEKIRLKSHYLDKRCNRWLPGEYYRSQLPEEIQQDPLYIAPIDISQTESSISRYTPGHTVQTKINFALEKQSRTNIGNNAGKLISVNTASEKELKKVNGIGDKLSANIILNRPYKDFEDLKAKVDAKWATIDISELTI
jgi:hypothetical protein